MIKFSLDKRCISFFIIGFFIIGRSYGVMALGTTPFITTWGVGTSGTDNSITIPTYVFETYNYTVDWGDGTPNTVETGNATHTYASPGIYTVSITGVFPRIYFNELYDESLFLNSDKLLTIEQWGDNAWTSMEYAFAGCKQLQGNFTDAPNLSNVTSLRGMFFGNKAFNYPIGDWDVSTVTDISQMFEQTPLFNQDIGNWDVSQVTNMYRLFYTEETECPNITPPSFFNQDIGSWDVSRVTDISEMFLRATSFNQDISRWDVSSVTNISQLFSNAQAFNQNVGKWDVSNVTNMYGMFLDAAAFNQDLSGWDVSSVTRMHDMFSGAIVFNQDIGDWDITNVIRMNNMFSGAISFNQDISNWDVSNVVYMANLFSKARTFNQDIGGWDVSNVTSLAGMFDGALAFNQDIGSWNVGNVSNMDFMLANTVVFNQDISNWDISRVTTMSSMFLRATAFNQYIGKWDVSAVEWMNSLFKEATAFNQDLSGWDVSNVIYMEEMFSGATAFDQDLGNWDVAQVTKMKNMFLGVTLSVLNYDNLLIGWDTLDLQPNVNFHGGNSKYCAATTARANMEANNYVTDFSRITDNWIISDGGILNYYIDDLAWKVASNNYTLPIITGYGLSGNEKYYTASKGKGVAYSAGDVINYSDFPVYPLTLYIYDEGISGCSEEQDFELIITTIPNCTTLLLPLPNANNVPTDTHLSWRKVDKAKGYKLTVGTTSNGTDVLNAFDVGNETIYNLPTDLPESTSIFVTVIPYNSDGEAVDCSEAFFTTESAGVLPLCSELTAPLNEAINVSTATNLSWNVSPDATGYKLSIGTFSEGTDILNSKDIGNFLSYNLPENLPENKTVYVTVVAYNSNGNAKDCSEESFTTAKTDTSALPPKFFTPNNDGVNDYWVVPDPLSEISKVLIYNRYGKLLKEIKNISEGWEGNSNGAPVSSGGYWYLILYKNGTTQNGHFSLVR
ncbi:BspA family leucine-rich repeat surface protein [Algibacter miyuki]|uniref:BspA family leucine-rich repeat surface protein n=1 Tax=Algibacter miyuki TaxID=1306933 RepID=A0ABV5H0I6_9FLAO|nr:BspA family leucine-rich repeat surface protein [Algibacter miyuki]MDN3667353.1 BspA family leucine-rich repeat surface protein [Algibacter miyuki]